MDILKQLLEEFEPEQKKRKNIFQVHDYALSKSLALLTWFLFSFTVLYNIL